MKHMDNHSASVYKRKGLRPLTKKQKAFADTLINNPKMSATQAVLKTYGKPEAPTTIGTAQQIAHDNLSKPNVQLYMNSHIDKAKMTVVSLMDSKKDDIRLRASESILDRTYGKPTQKTDNTSTSLVAHISSKPYTI